MLRPLSLLLLLLLTAGTALAGGGPLNVLLLVNDNSQDSLAAAEHYARARGIPPRNFVYLKTARTHTISLKAYVEQVREPILRALRAEGLEKQILYIVATQGMPMRVKLPGKGNRIISLCAALQALGADLDRIPGLGAGRNIKRNPYFQARKAFSRDLDLGTPIYLSTMLAGFDLESAKALVDRAMEAEKNPPPPGLFLFQDARGNAASRNRQYDQAVAAIGAKGFRARRIGPGTAELGKLKPLIAWFSGGSYSGLKRKALRQVKFHPGALVDMLESFGAVPKNFTDDGKFSQVPVTWMIEAGATLVHGAVAEPFSVSFPTAQAPIDYLAGFNAAEAIFMNTPTFYWKNLLLGDPLCAPYAKRPEFRAGLDKLLPGPVGGRVVISPEGQDIRYYELYVGGLLQGRARPGETLAWNTLDHPDGPISLRVAALGSAPGAPRAAVTREIPVFNQELRVLRMDQTGERDTTLVELSRPPAFPVPEGALLLTGPEGKVLKVEVQQVGERKLKVTPRTPLPASSSFKLLITPQLKDREGRRLGREYSYEFRSTASHLALEGPAQVIAGQACTFQVLAKGTSRPSSPPDEGFTGKIKLTTSDPESDQPKPVDARRGRATFTMTFRTAGPCRVEAVNPATGLKGSLEVLVKPAPFARVDLQVPEKWIAGNALRLQLSARDEFGNATPATSPVLRIFVGDDGPHLTQLQILDKGRKEVLLPCPWAPGDCPVKVLDGTEQIWEGKTTLVPGGLVQWLQLGPFEAERSRPLECPAPPREPPAAGSITAGKVWKPGRAPGKLADLKHNLPWLKKDRAGWLSTGLMAVEDCKLQVLLGLGGTACQLYLDGRRLGEATAGQAYRHRALVQPIKLGPGYHWFGLALTKKTGGVAAFNLVLLGQEGTAQVPDLCFYPQDPYGGREDLTISGRVRCGWKGIPRIAVQLLAPGGRRLKTRSAENGIFVFSGLEPGEYTLQPSSRSFAFQPLELLVSMAGGNRWDLDFILQDKAGPKVKILSPRQGAKAGINLNARARVVDDVGVRVVWWCVNGEPLGGKHWHPPYRKLLNLGGLKPGRHKLTVIAEDYAGNRGEDSLYFFKR